MEYDTVKIPRKFWLIFNIPGFYNISEYTVDRTSVVDWVIEKIYG